MSRPYQICTRTIMDTTDPDIVFDENGVCNYVRNYEEACKSILVPEDKREAKLHELVDRIRTEGKNNEYDCIIGLSGGVDSSYVAYVVKNLGLRPLAVHMDNGWNSELAVHNIEQIVKRLQIDLVTYVIDWEEFKDLQLAYLRASVVDIEALTDNAIVVAINRIAKKFGVRYFISGTNLATEFIMPRTWFYDIKYDSLNIKAIHKRFGKIRKLETYPLFNFLEYVYFRYYKKEFNTISILNYVPYEKKKVIPVIEEKLGWRNYGRKHGESKFTQFYQEYILPVKFNIDKRRPFLSTLILSGQITREEALLEIEKPLYTPRKLKEDIEFVAKKFNLTLDEFDRIMKLPPKPHYDYPSYDGMHKRLRAFIRKLTGR
jgi:N-acetyl sugar amidotransferase